MTTRTCKNCGQEKPFERGAWRWASRYGPYGRICQECHIHNDREKNTKQHAEFRKQVNQTRDRVTEVARENAFLKKQLKKLIEEADSDY